MSTHILIPLISKQLGHSLCYEEHKGHYKQASELAASSVEAARNSGNITQLADALLASGVVYLMQGKPTAAMNYFTEIEQLAQCGIADQLYAANGNGLAAYYDNNLFPPWGGANGGEELEAKNKTLLERVAKQSQRRSELLPYVTDPAVRLTDRLMSDVLKNILPMSSSLDLAYTVPATDTAQVLDYGLRVPLSFREEAESLGADQSLLAYTMLVAADLAWRGRRYDQARSFLQQALQDYSQVNDRAGMATCQMTWGDWLAAPFSSPLRWNLALQTGGLEGSNLSWTVEAVEFTQQGANLDQALVAYQSAENLFWQASAPRGLAALQLRHSYLAMLHDDYLTATDHARMARQAFAECGDWLGYYLVQIHLILTRVGAGEVAEQHELAQAVGHWGATEGSFSYVLGLGLLLSRAARHWLLRRSDYERALTTYRLAQTLFAALGATTNQGQSLVDQAETYYAIGERNAARTAYAQALDLYEEAIRARPRIASTLRKRIILLAVDTFNFGVQAMNADEMDSSTEHLQKQLEQLPTTPTNIADIIELMHKGVFDALHDSTIAEAMDQAAYWGLRDLAQSTITQGKVTAPLYRALHARDAGDEERASHLFAEALAAARATTSEDRYWLEATVLAQQKQYTLARAAFDHYIQRSGAAPSYAKGPIDILDTGASTGKVEALRQEERSYSLAFTFMVRIKAYEEASQYLQKLLQIAGDDWWSHDTRPWINLSDCAEMYRGIGRLPDALTYYDRAIAMLEGRRKLLSRDELKTAMASDQGVQYLYFLAARTTLEMQEDAEKKGDHAHAAAYAAYAFDYMEQGRARALLDLMVSSVTLAGTSHTESQIMHDWRRITAQLTLWRGLLAQEHGRRGSTQPDPQRMAALEQQIETGEAELRSIEIKLGAANPLLHQALSTQAPIITVEKLRKALPPGVALLEYAFLGEDLLVWAFNSKGITQTYHASVDAKALTRQIRNLHRACEPPVALTHSQAWEPLAAELGKTLLAPLDKTIRASQRLIIVPYGAAHSLPFHILPWEGKPLICSRAVSYLPSASVLQFLEHSQPSLHQHLLAIGNPTDMAYQPPEGGTPIKLNALRAAETEAQFVASLFPNGRALVRAEAVTSTVLPLLAEYPLLHFATHGYLSDEAPLLSAIMLANGESLSLYELMGLRLNADLVVLSACNTARGETTGGDDVLGLTRGLLSAGARAAVVSLWSVESLSTSLLMEHFYRKLLQSPEESNNQRATRVTKAEALQSAQLYVKNLTAQHVVDYCNFHLRTLSQPGDVERTLSFQLGRANAEVIAGDLTSAMATYHDVQRQLSTLTNEWAKKLASQVGETLYGLEFVIEESSRHPIVNYDAKPFGHLYYWAPFVLVGDWK